MGAVFDQRHGKVFHLIYYANRTLVDAQLNYTTEKDEGKFEKLRFLIKFRNVLWRLTKYILPRRARVDKKGLKVDTCCYATWLSSHLGIHAPCKVDTNSWVLQGLEFKEFE